MADEHVIQTSATDMDYAEHDRTYGLFLSLTKWTAITAVGIVVLMALFLL